MSRDELLKRYIVTTDFKSESKKEVRGFLEDFILADGVNVDMFEIKEGSE